MRQRYEYRHNTLAFLFNKLKFKNSEKIDTQDSLSTHSEIAAALGITQEEFYKIHLAFHTIDKLHVKCGLENNVHAMVITEDGMIAFIDEYWLNEGRAQANEKIYQKSKWLVPAIALVITVCSLTISTCIVTKTNKKIERLEQEINSIKGLPANH